MSPAVSRPEGWEEVSSVLAVRLDNVGDVVDLAPALRCLRAALPGVSLTLLASPGGGQVAPLLPWVDDVIVWRAVWQDASGALPLDPARELALVEQLRARSFDAALIFTSFSQSPWPPAYACYLAGIPLRAGESKEFGGRLLSHRAPPLPDRVHQVERNLHLLRWLGIPVDDGRLELRLPAEATLAAGARLAEAGVDPDEPFVALAPGASCPARRYPPERFAEVASALADDGLPVVVLAGAREVGLVRPVLAAGAGRPDRRLVSLAGQTSVPELAAVIARSALVVANDSGPMHLADAFERPVVVLYSGTDLESQWRPRRSPCQLLRRPTPCSPCYRFDCPFEMACLDIPPAEVVACARRLLSARPPREEVRSWAGCAS